MNPHSLFKNITYQTVGILKTFLMGTTYSCIVAKIFEFNPKNLETPDASGFLCMMTIASLSMYLDFIGKKLASKEIDDIETPLNPHEQIEHIGNNYYRNLGLFLYYTSNGLLLSLIFTFDDVPFLMTLLYQGLNLIATLHSQTREICYDNLTDKLFKCNIVYFIGVLLASRLNRDFVLKYLFYMVVVNNEFISLLEYYSRKREIELRDIPMFLTTHLGTHEKIIRILLYLYIILSTVRYCTDK